MSADRILTAVGLLAAVVAVFVPLEWWGLILLAVGLVSGFMSPSEDMLTRIGYTVAAVALPTLANSLDAIPVAGVHLNGIIDNFAIVIGGIVIANFVLVLFARLMDSGD